MNTQIKLQQAREKMGGTFPWERKEWRYTRADNTDIRKTFAGASRFERLPVSIMMRRSK